MAVDVTEALRSLLEGIMGDKQAAMDYLEDPDATMAEAGLSDTDLSDVDVASVVGDVALDMGFQG
ncbi:MAG: hypothetical protein KDB21_00515, partial [Acidimicrobiales bacterium]|nr:hypothetical protein [Acidimicrobiales bacterium]